jgi:hypothetical protein
MLFDISVKALSLTSEEEHRRLRMFKKRVQWKIIWPKERVTRGLRKMQLSMFVNG